MPRLKNTSHLFSWYKMSTLFTRSAFPKGLTTLNFFLLAFVFFAQGVIGLHAQPLWGTSPITQPYPYVTTGGMTGPAVPESPDPLVAYRWANPKATDGFEIYLLKPTAVFTVTPGSFTNANSLTGAVPNVTVNGTGSLRLDFGRENAAWLEFDSPDLIGNVEMSIGEANQPGIGKTAGPTKIGNTYRLQWNSELYDGVRFGWITVKSFSSAWHITGIRLVCQTKPTNYQGSFSSSDTMLTKIWYVCAYGVKLNLLKNYLGAILMDRGDRMSWTGDAHPAQAASLVAFGNYDFIKLNIANTSGQNNGIASYSLYWVLSLVDYYNYSGDSATMSTYIANAVGKLDNAYGAGAGFDGWDERLDAGFEMWFTGANQEVKDSYKMLVIRTWMEFADAMGKFGRADLQAKYNKLASDKMTALRVTSTWSSAFGLHAAASAINTGLLTRAEQDKLADKEFMDRVNRISISQFNQYFIIQAMARSNRFDEAISSAKDLWGEMIKYGGTTPFEVYRPTWNKAIGTNGAVPNTQSGLTSLCHPWGSGPVKWMNEELLGIKPTTPGFKTYAIIPHLGRSLTSVKGKTPTSFGDISASFNIATGACQIIAPPGTVGRFGIPKAEKSISSIAINGITTWDNAFHATTGIGGATQDSEYVYFSAVQPGTYNIAVTYTGSTPVYSEPAEIYPAQFIKQDSTTGGNWGGVYGAQGYVLCNYNDGGVDKKSLPSYVTSVKYFRAFGGSNQLPDNTSWASNTTDTRALAPDSTNQGSRNSRALSNAGNTFTFTIEVNGIHDYQVALYFVDWDNKTRSHVVEMFDATTLKMVAPVQIVENYRGGKYLVYTYNKSAKFRLDKIRGDIVPLSGMFFGPKPLVGISAAFDPLQITSAKNSPNPFRGGTQIKFTIAGNNTPVDVSLRVYDMHGLLVKQLLNQPKKSGVYSVRWNGANEQGVPVAPGTYIYRLQVGTRQELVRKMMKF